MPHYTVVYMTIFILINIIGRIKTSKMLTNFVPTKIGRLLFEEGSEILKYKLQDVIHYKNCKPYLLPLSYARLYIGEDAYPNLWKQRNRREIYNLG